MVKMAGYSCSRDGEGEGEGEGAAPAGAVGSSVPLMSVRRGWCSIVVVER